MPKITKQDRDAFQAAHDRAAKRWRNGMAEYRPTCPTAEEKRAYREKHGKHHPSAAISRCNVGFVFCDLFFDIRGYGDTWEQAWKMADEREKHRPAP